MTLRNENESDTELKVDTCVMSTTSVNASMFFAVLSLVLINMQAI